MVRRVPYAAIPEEKALCPVFLVQQSELYHSKQGSTNDITTNRASVIGAPANGTYQKEDEATLSFTSF